MLGPLAAVALAVPPPLVEVVVVEAPARPRPWSRPVADVVPVTALDVAADGVDERAWAEAVRAPPLLPTGTGPAPPALDLRVARAAEALVVRVGAPVRGSTVLLALDPDGTQARWWKVEVGTERARTWTCSLVGLTFERPAIVPPRAAPCGPGEGVGVAFGEALIEVAFPTGDLTGQARLQVAVRGPRGAGGTWSHTGLAEARPELGRRLALPVIDAKVERGVDAASGAHRLVLTPGREESGAWTWRRLARGGEVAAGEVEVRPGEPVTLTLPWRHEPQGMVEVADPADPARTLIVPLSDPEPAAWMRTPFYADALEVGFVTPGPVEGLRVALEDGRGRPLGEATVDLPQGTGWLRVVPGVPAEEVVVRLGSLTAAPLRARRL